MSCVWVDYFLGSIQEDILRLQHQVGSCADPARKENLLNAINRLQYAASCYRGWVNQVHNQIHPEPLE